MDRGHLELGVVGRNQRDVLLCSRVVQSLRKLVHTIVPRQRWHSEMNVRGRQTAFCQRVRQVLRLIPTRSTAVHYHFSGAKPKLSGNATDDGCRTSGGGVKGLVLQLSGRSSVCPARDSFLGLLRARSGNVSSACGPRPWLVGL